MRTGSGSTGSKTSQGGGTRSKKSPTLGTPAIQSVTPTARPLVDAAKTVLTVDEMYTVDESSGEVRDQDVVIARICSVEAALVSSVAAAMPHWSPDVFKIAADTRDRPLLLMSMLLFENLEVGY